MDFVLYIFIFALGAAVGFLLALLAARRNEQRMETWREREERLYPENVGEFYGGVYGCPPDMMPCDERRTDKECRACWDRPGPTDWKGDKKRQQFEFVSVADLGLREYSAEDPPCAKRRETWREREKRLWPEYVSDILFTAGVYGCPPDMTFCEDERLREVQEKVCRACWDRPVPTGWEEDGV